MKTSSLCVHLLALLVIYQYSCLGLKRAIMIRQTTPFTIPTTTIGTRSTVLFHDYFPNPQVQQLDRNSLEWYGQDRAYIQASLHADELPGLLVCHHLIKLLDVAAGEGRIKKQITIVPYANPIGLNQVMQGKHFGRFSLLSGTNFNRNWLDVTEKVVKRLEEAAGKGEGEGLRREDGKWNTAVIRKALYEEASKLESNKPEVLWKKELFRRICTSSVVLDLHCDSDAVLHMYTHDRLWPELADLSAAMDSKCCLLESTSGGNPLDESASDPWRIFSERFPDFPIEMACHAVTIELRGENEVYDEIAAQDARNLYAFLVRRGYVDDSNVPPLTNLADQVGLPLAGVDMIEATAPGVLAWKVRVGDTVKKGQLLGEIVNIEDVDAPRVPVISSIDGIIFARDAKKLAVPGDVIIKVAGSQKLDWRTGNLLTSK